MKSGLGTSRDIIPRSVGPLLCCCSAPVYLLAESDSFANRDRPPPFSSCTSDDGGGGGGGGVREGGPCLQSRNLFKFNALPANWGARTSGPSRCTSSSPLCLSPRSFKSRSACYATFFGGALGGWIMDEAGGAGRVVL